MTSVSQYPAYQSSIIQNMKDLDPNMIFFVERSTNTNAVVYSAQRRRHGNAEGDAEAGGCERAELDQSEPVKAHWVMMEKRNSPTEALSFVERTAVYGPRAKKSDQLGHYTLTIPLISHHSFDVHLNDHLQPVATTTIRQQAGRHVSHIYVRFHQNIAGIQTVDYYEVFTHEGDYERVYSRLTNFLDEAFTLV